MLRLNGYSTAAFGKSHETAAWELSPSGPTDRWPTRSGFDKFYGFIGGASGDFSHSLGQVRASVGSPTHVLSAPNGGHNRCGAKAPPKFCRASSLLRMSFDTAKCTVAEVWISGTSVVTRGLL
jgi:arylsulfatase A-like enzyme